MRDQNEYSDELISAYIDGELDKYESAQLLSNAQKNNELGQRLEEARTLKEKVRLAYTDLPPERNVNKPFNGTAFISHYKFLAASFFILLAIAAFILPAITNNDEVILAKQLIKNTRPITANTIGEAIGTRKQIIINISQYQAQNFDTTLDNIEKILLQNNTDKSFSIEIVANKTGLRALDTETSLHAERIALMAEKFDNLEVIACAKSLAKLASEGDPVQLMKSILITPSAAQQVAKRTGKGWLYLKI